MTPEQAQEKIVIGVKEAKRLTDLGLIEDATILLSAVMNDEETMLALEELWAGDNRSYPEDNYDDYYDDWYEEEMYGI